MGKDVDEPASRVTPLDRGLVSIAAFVDFRFGRRKKQISIEAPGLYE